MARIAISVSVWLISVNILQLGERTQESMKFEINKDINSFARQRSLCWEKIWKSSEKTAPSVNWDMRTFRGTWANYRENDSHEALIVNLCRIRRGHHFLYLIADCFVSMVFLFKYVVLWKLTRWSWPTDLVEIHNTEWLINVKITQPYFSFSLKDVSLCSSYPDEKSIFIFFHYQ